MTQHADPRIARHDALRPPPRIVGPVDHGHLPRVLRIADPHAAAIVYRTPTRPGRGIQHGVQKGPIGNGVATVAHGLGLAVRRGDGAAIEMIAADYDRRGDLAFRDHAVDLKRKLRALAIAEPAN